MDEKKLGSRLLYIPASCDLTFVAWAELVWTIFRKEAWPLGEHPELFRVSVQAFYHESDVGEFVEVSLADQVLVRAGVLCEKDQVYCQRAPEGCLGCAASRSTGAAESGKDGSWPATKPDKTIQINWKSHLFN